MAEPSPLEKNIASLFAKTIRERREDLGMSQEEVAQKAGIDRNHYQLMEHARPTARQIGQLTRRCSLFCGWLRHSICPSKIFSRGSLSPIAVKAVPVFKR